MRAVLMLAFVLMVGGFGLDNLTTYMALSNFAHKFHEVNPLARAQFHLIGLGPGLIVNFIMGFGVALFIVYSDFVQTDRAKAFLLGLLGFIRWHAGIHNLALLLALGGWS
jgi:hypothetical protein